MGVGLLLRLLDDIPPVDTKYAHHRCLQAVVEFVTGLGIFLVPQMYPDRSPE